MSYIQLVSIICLFRSILIAISHLRITVRAYQLKGQIRNKKLQHKKYTNTHTHTRVKNIYIYDNLITTAPNKITTQIQHAISVKYVSEF